LDITASKRDLLRLVSRCQGIAQAKSTLPALACVQLRATSPGELQIAATDLYLSVTGTVAAEGRSVSNGIGLPAKDLHERLKAMPDGPVHLVVADGYSATLKAGGGARRYTMRGLPGDDLPAISTASQTAPTLDLDLGVLTLLIGRTNFAISTDETRVALNSALFEQDGHTLRMVATDGHRLSVMAVQTEADPAQWSMLLPIKAVGELRRFADEAKAEAGKDGSPKVRITQDGSNAFFEIAGLRFSVKLAAAQFPPYTQIVPEKHDHVARVPRALFADALRAVSLSSLDRVGGVKLTLARGCMRITSESPEKGDGADEVPIEYDGPELAIGFNARYLLDILGALSDETVALGFGGDLDPAAIRLVGEPEGQRYVAIVMPMRV